MPIPRAIARLNRVGLNRIIKRIAPRLPAFGVVIHQGRRTGRSYRTPVNVFATADGYLVALTYGKDSDWVKNVLSAGGCELITRGRRVRLVSPRLRHDVARRGVPAPVRPILRLLRVADFLQLSLDTSGG